MSEWTIEGDETMRWDVIASAGDSRPSDSYEDGVLVRCPTCGWERYTDDVDEPAECVDCTLDREEVAW